MEAAVDGDGGAGDVAPARGDEEGDEQRHVLRAAHVAEGKFRASPLIASSDWAATSRRRGVSMRPPSSPSAESKPMRSRIVRSSVFVPWFIGNYPDYARVQQAPPLTDALKITLQDDGRAAAMGLNGCVVVGPSKNGCN